ncbi:hypothetical protein ACTFIZ_007726 [Dictyostelium cf. discoideum]
MIKNRMWNKISIILIVLILCLFGVESIRMDRQHPIKSAPPEAPFSMETAFQLLMYSYSTYCEPDQITNWNCPYCAYNSSVVPLSMVQLIDHDPTQTFGYIGVTADKESIVISFRGTNMESLENWITNLNFAKTEPYPAFPGALVHAGFNRAYQSVRPIVHQLLNSTFQACPTCNKLIMTGHSLGGALSVLSALDIYESSLTTMPLILYTYGSPRIGDVAFVEYFESTIMQNYIRIVNDHDLVPHLPAMAWNFYHLPQEIWFNNKSDVTQHVICNESGEDENCSDSIKIALNIPEHLEYFGINKNQC